MKTFFFVLPVTVSLSVGSIASVHAQSLGNDTSGIPKSAQFIGIGAGYDFANFGNQAVYNKGLSNVYQGGALVATGSADGPAVQTSLGHDDSIFPEVRYGYYQHLGNTDWLIGFRFSYSYLGAKSTTSNLVIPQYGTSSNSAVSTFEGYSVTNSYSVSVRHQTSAMAFFGRSFGQGFVYAGAGPSFSQVNVELDGVVGWATINGVLTDISGAPQSFSSKDWRVGAAATFGAVYFLTPSWFVDMSYFINALDGRTASFTSPFNNPGSPSTFTGTLIGTATANVPNTQAITVSLNKAF